MRVCDGQHAHAKGSTHQFIVPPRVCNTFTQAVFFNIHSFKAGGTTTECTLAKKHHAHVTNMSAYRPHFSFQQVGNHATFLDFVTGVPGLKRDQQGLRCPHTDLWLPNGKGCAGRRQDTCYTMVTWLRDPVERFLSAYTMMINNTFSGQVPMKKNSSAFRLFQASSRPDPSAVILALREDEWLDSPSTNAQTLMLGGDSHRYVPSKDRFARVDHSGFEILRVAKRRLESLDFVGVAHRMLDSFALLSWWIGIPPLNVTCLANRATDFSRFVLTSDAVAIIRKYNALDEALFKHASDMFDRRWNQFANQEPKRVVYDKYNCKLNTRNVCNSIHTKPKICRQDSYCVNSLTTGAVPIANVKPSAQ